MRKRWTSLQCNDHAWTAKFSERDLGPEDAMQIDLLPNFRPSGGYEIVLTAIDVFSHYLFAYPLTDASATNVAKVRIDVITRVPTQNVQ